MAEDHDHDDVWDAIRDLRHQIDSLRKAEMSTQAQADATTATLTQVAGDLATSNTNIQTELNNLQAQITAGTPIDLTALIAAAAPLDAAAQAIGALVPAPPAPPAPGA